MKEACPEFRPQARIAIFKTQEELQWRSPKAGGSVSCIGSGTDLISDTGSGWKSQNMSGAGGLQSLVRATNLGGWLSGVSIGSSDRSHPVSSSSAIVFSASCNSGTCADGSSESVSAAVRMFSTIRSLAPGFVFDISRITACSAPLRAAMSTAMLLAMDGVISSVIRIPFDVCLATAKGAGNRGGGQAPVVCGNTAGGAAITPSLSAERGQARLHVAPKYLPVGTWRAAGLMLRAPFSAGVARA